MEKMFMDFFFSFAFFSQREIMMKDFRLQLRGALELCTWLYFSPKAYLG